MVLNDGLNGEWRIVADSGGFYAYLKSPDARARARSRFTKKAIIRHFEHNPPFLTKSRGFPCWHQ